MSKDLLIRNAQTQFEFIYSRKPTCYAYAPGRVNIIGEHVDYNDGFVMPCAIDFGTVVCGAKNNLNLIRIYSVDFSREIEEIDIFKPINAKQGEWSNYLRGVVKVFVSKGITLRGMDILIKGDVPLGAGLSSSASLEVSFATLINGLFELNFSEQEIALFSQKAEHFTGCNCGIMDQMASACAKENHLLLIDCKSLECSNIPFSDDLDILIINSNVKHSLVESEYNQRRKECERASEKLQVHKLRDASFDDLQKAKDNLTQLEYKRAKHVITENLRTFATVDALKCNDFKRVSQLLKESHLSLKDDYQVSIEEIDFIVDYLYEIGGDKVGARITGGGFGGCVVALIKKGFAQVISSKIKEAYLNKFGKKINTYLTSPSQGAFFIKC